MPLKKKPLGIIKLDLEGPKAVKVLVEIMGIHIYCTDDCTLDCKIQIDPMITHVLSFEEINKGFELMHAGESIRSVVVN